MKGFAIWVSLFFVMVCTVLIASSCSNSRNFSFKKISDVETFLKKNKVEIKDSSFAKFDAQKDPENDYAIINNSINSDLLLNSSLFEFIKLPTYINDFPIPDDGSGVNMTIKSISYDKINISGSINKNCYSFNADIDFIITIQEASIPIPIPLKFNGKIKNKMSIKNTNKINYFGQGFNRSDLLLNTYSFKYNVESKFSSDNAIVPEDFLDSMNQTTNEEFSMHSFALDILTGEHLSLNLFGNDLLNSSPFIISDYDFQNYGDISLWLNSVPNYSYIC